MEDGKTCMMLFFMIVVATLEMMTANGVALEMHSPGKLPCGGIHSISSLVVTAIRWTKSTSDISYVNGNQAIATWDNGNQTAASGYDLDSEFYLVIKNVSVGDIGIYRCTIFYGRSDKMEHDINMSVYKQPMEAPLITYHVEKSEINFNCSVGPLFPLHYPEFQDHHDRSDYVTHDDGSFTVRISRNVTYHTKSIKWFCVYSYHHGQISNNLKSTLDLNLGSIEFATTTYAPHCANDTAAVDGEAMKQIAVMIAVTVFSLSIVLSTLIWFWFRRRNLRHQDNPVKREQGLAENVLLDPKTSHLNSTNTFLIHIDRHLDNNVWFKLCPARNRGSCECPSVSETEELSNMNLASWLLMKNAKPSRA